MRLSSNVLKGLQQVELRSVVAEVGWPADPVLATIAMASYEEADLTRISADMAESRRQCTRPSRLSSPPQLPDRDDSSRMRAKTGTSPSPSLSIVWAILGCCTDLCTGVARQAPKLVAPVGSSTQNGFEVRGDGYATDEALPLPNLDRKEVAFQKQLIGLQ